MPCRKKVDLIFCCFDVFTVGIASDTALAGRPGVSPHAAAAAASAVTMPKELAKDAVIPMHSISPTLYVKGLTYQHILSVDMFTKEQVSGLVKFRVRPIPVSGIGRYQ